MSTTPDRSRRGSWSTPPWARPQPREPRPFVLQRDEDTTGVSGTGRVAEGVEFSDGTVALRWTSRNPTSVVFHDRGIESVRAVHGHDGRTRIVWTGREATRDVLELLGSGALRQEVLDLLAGPWADHRRSLTESEQDATADVLDAVVRALTRRAGL